MNIKCIGCYKLRRVETTLGGLVVYNCPRFPYTCAMAGLLRPTRAILKAVNDCPDDPLSHCVVCLDPGTIHYSKDTVSICREHDAAWGKWLTEHPERRAHLAPRGRSIKANWVEVFREFVEDMRTEPDHDLPES